MNSASQLRQTIKLAWPISLQNMLVTLLSMIDVVMVGHLGNAAVASVGLGNRIQFVVLVIATGLSWGVGVLAAQYFGAGKSDKIRRSIQIASVIALLAFIPIAIGNFYFAETIILWASSDLEVIALGEVYLWITMPSLIFVALVLIVENALRSIGQVKLPLAFSFVAIVINIVLNYWLINGGFGIPALGVEGAAWATLLSRALHFVIIWAFLIKHRHLLAPKAGDLSLLANRSAWSQLFQLIWPMMVSFGIWSIGTFVYQLIYGQLGTEALAVMSLLSPIEGIFLSIFFGLASACSIMVGQKLGADAFAQAWQVAKSFFFICPLVAVGLGGAALLLEGLIFSPYENMSAQTLATAHQVFMLIALGAWLKVCNMTLALGVIRAGGDNKFCMITDIFGLWVVSIPLTFVAATIWQLPLIWVAMAAYSEEVVKLTLFSWRTFSKKWMRNLSAQAH
ncbi:MATE family efflux transporter [Thalassotalea euphylliae]|uniref:Multidrug-efflux transporter n=1 Tax=Thalassotalea euphylliae TaxID=1655234 RepID=A0A3E0TSV6_9GAMM|nr:MATE family efflux transporter [Thalassotalea euphylliae]REL27563.1 MATE family efflux transporter [Thalassotalea euphylliae]